MSQPQTPANAPRRQGAPISLWPEIARGLLRRAMRPFRILWRRGFIYRSFLKGKLCDHITFYPYDALPRRLEDADALMRGRFRFGGDAVDVKEGSIFDQPAPTPAWNDALQSFAWLPPLSAAGGDASRTLATNLLSQWLRRNARYSEPAFEPQVVARRLIHLFAHGRFVLANSDVLWRSKVFVSLREQVKLLARTAMDAPAGLPRLEAATAFALSGACLNDNPKRLEAGLLRLEQEIAEQILPDGGHTSRSPEALVHAFRHIVMVADALTAIEHPIPHTIRSAHDRMAPMLRFFRHGDGGLALFNGGRECDPRMIAGILARDEVRGQPFLHAPHSGYQRLASGKSLFIMDCGTPPYGAFSNDAHASPLAFEFSAGQYRIVVNCGSAGEANSKWDSALRATAAHSTVTIADTSTASVLSAGTARDILGARLLGGPREVTTSRGENLHGRTVEAVHDGYLRPFGLRHQRTVTLSQQGSQLTGCDAILPVQGRKQTTPFAVRFHIHPDVRMSTSQGGGIILKLPNGEGWRFRCGGNLSIEESIYLGGAPVRRTEQIVISGTVKDQPVEVAWTFEQMGAI